MSCDNQDFISENTPLICIKNKTDNTGDSWDIPVST